MTSYGAGSRRGGGRRPLGVQYCNLSEAKQRQPSSGRGFWSSSVALGDRTSQSLGSEMGVRRRTLLLGFVVSLFLGVAIYFRLWAIDNESFSADDREVLRKQFERANLEAMDESAEWRMKYDREVEKGRLFQDELLKVRASLTSATKRFAMLQKENMSLQRQVESLKQQIGAKEQHCNCNQSSTEHQQ